jgi:hypothetical protein
MSLSLRISSSKTMSSSPWYVACSPAHKEGGWENGEGWWGGGHSAPHVAARPPGAEVPPIQRAVGPGKRMPAGGAPCTALRMSAARPGSTSESLPEPSELELPDDVPELCSLATKSASCARGNDAGGEGAALRRQRAGMGGGDVRSPGHPPRSPGSAPARAAGCWPCCCRASPATPTCPARKHEDAAASCSLAPISVLKNGLNAPTRPLHGDGSAGASESLMAQPAGLKCRVAGSAGAQQAAPSSWAGGSASTSSSGVDPNKHRWAQRLEAAATRGWRMHLSQVRGALMIPGRRLYQTWIELDRRRQPCSVPSRLPLAVPDDQRCQ